MSTAKVTVNEVIESMTGREENLVAETFGINPYAEDENGNSLLPGSMFLRALVFICERRNGKTDAEAYDAAMDLPQKSLLTYFAPDGDEESGKESDSSEPQPENSQPSAS
jgi:hypothetical protein